MKLITDEKEIENEFQRLMKDYSEFYWAVAWAGASFDLSKKLKKFEKKIRKIVISTQMFNTHPDFIREFLKNKRIRYYPRNTRGIFHPKVYLFRNGTKWEAMIGSANFTEAAFTINTEAVVLTSHRDPDSKSLHDKAMKLVRENWSRTACFDQEALKEYEEGYKKKREHEEKERNSWKQFKKRAKPRLDASQYGGMTWKEFVREVKAEGNHPLTKRIEVMEKAIKLFAKHKHFKDLDLLSRKKIAGTIPESEFDDGVEWHYFGHVLSRGDFRNAVIDISKRPEVSEALDQIPRNGKVTESHFNRFVKEFEKGFMTNELAGGTRLLAMKRPDVFVCFNNANKTKLCKDFGISAWDMTFDRYWDEVIERIYDSEWWKAKKPENLIEAKIWKARSAFLDAIFYEF